MLRKSCEPELRLRHKLTFCRGERLHVIGMLRPVLLPCLYKHRLLGNTEIGRNGLMGDYSREVFGLYLKCPDDTCEQLLQSGHFRYSDLKEAAPVGHLWNLNGADGCWRLSGCRVCASCSRYQGGRFDAQCQGEEVDSSSGLYQRRQLHGMRQRFPVRSAGRPESEFCKPVHAAHLTASGGERSRSSAAVTRSTTCMVPPQTGQFHSD